MSSGCHCTYLSLLLICHLANDVYIEKSHGLHEVPALVIVRIKLQDGNLVGWYSDTVGRYLIFIFFKYFINFIRYEGRFLCS